MMNELEVIERLKAAQPTRVVAILADGETKQPVAVPAKGQKWSRVWARVSQLAWSELLLLDGKGALLDRLLNDGPAGDLEPLGAGKGGDLTTMTGVASLFQTMARDVVKTTVGGLQAMKNTHREEMRDILDAHKDLARQAFTLHAEACVAHEKAKNAWEAEREQLVATIMELRAEILELRHKREPSEKDKREEQLVGLLMGGGKKLGEGAPAAAPTNGTPLGG